MRKRFHAPRQKLLQRHRRLRLGAYPHPHPAKAGESGNLPARARPQPPLNEAVA